MAVDGAVQAEAVGLLQALIRIESSNPPGGERRCAEVLAEWLHRDGYEPTLVEKQPGRTNLVVRRRGDGSGGGPLLLTGHLDVVPAEGVGWRHPPFSALVEDGWLYGRGAVDMKNHVAACAMVMSLLARHDVRLRRDVIFAAVADEEAGCELGSRFLVDEHPELVRAEWGLGELGAFTLRVGDARLYPIMVAHRGAAWFAMRARGIGGHGSLPREDSAVLRLARAVQRLGERRLPIHVGEAARRTLRSFGEARGPLGRAVMAMLADPRLTDFVLTHLIRDPALRRTLGAMVRNTATPTVLRAGTATNVIPELAEAHVDGRILPGQTSADLLREIRDAVGDPGVELELLREIAPVQSPFDSALYRHLEQAIRAMDPGGVPFPYLMPGFTDASHFSRLGVRMYGFTPVVLPEHPAVTFGELYHGRDERLPLAGFGRGLEALYRVVTGFCA